MKIEGFKDKVCFVSFVDEGKPYHQKGKITDIDENFIYLETFTNLFAINLKDIIKIKSAIDGGQG